jgi:hypothetical protein
MSNLAATDVTYTINSKRRVNGRNYFNVTLAFGDGALTYPAGGVPITIGKLGCPNTIESLTIYDKGTSGYEWSYDTTNKKLVGFYSPAVAANTATHTHDILVKGGQAASTTNDVAVYTALLGKEAATDATIVGANSATSGGVVASAALSISQAASALTQLSTVAIVATTLKCEVIGW